MPTPRPAPAGPRGRAAGGALAGPAAVGPTGRRDRARGPGRARNWVTESATTVVEGAVALQVVRFGVKAAQGKAKEATVDAAKDGLTMLRNTPEVAVVGQKKWLKLGASVAIDGLGVATYLLPGFGEAGDAAWAPISAVLVQALYGSALLSTIDLVEEALPFSDIVPTACIGWTVEYTPVGTWVRRPAIFGGGKKKKKKGKAEEEEEEAAA